MFTNRVVSNWEPHLTVRLVTLETGVAPCYWHVVNHPLVHVVLTDTIMKKVQLGFIIFVAPFISLGAQFSSSDVFSESYLSINVS